MNDNHIPCYHGGAFFEAIGPEFDCLERRHEIINADVLDAWFPPSPKVIAALEEDLPWLLRTSPPTNCEGLARVIAACVVCGKIVFCPLQVRPMPSSWRSDTGSIRRREF